MNVKYAKENLAAAIKLLERASDKKSGPHSFNGEDTTHYLIGGSLVTVIVTDTADSELLDEIFGEGNWGD